MNKGNFQIVSYDGFYQVGKGEKAIQLKHSFPGTVVNMEFRTDDTLSYSLASEADISNIF
jgi:ATP-binding region, ATPase-like protein